jgi:DNA polymerase-3 subunit epsilon
MRQIILDTETTGLSTQDGHRIIEIGCIELVNRKFTGNRYHQYINPMRAIDKEALDVHGITEDFLQSKPTFVRIIHEFMEFISGAELVIHNAPFDTGFINYELSLANKKWKSLFDHCRVVDTLVLARQLHMGQRNSLDALCKRYSVDNSNRDLHGALLDARLLAEVYLAMTGGQSSLFEETDAKELNQLDSNVIYDPLAVPRNLVVIHADQDELAVHEQKLQSMQEKGRCVWLTE